MNIRGDLFMKNKILINGLVLLSILACGCFIQGSCIATETQGPSLEFADVNNTEMEQYTRLAWKSIKNNWYPPTSSFEKSAILGITVDRQGKLVKCSIIKSSEDENFDNSLIEAAKKAKYMPLPKNFIEDKVDLSLEFGMQRRSIKK